MTKRNIKMIGLDLDGTLLNTKKEFTDHSKEVLTKAMEQGVIVLPSTGRPLTGIPEEVLHFPGIRYVVSSNGARVLDMQEEKVLYEREISYEDGKKLIEILQKYDMFLEIYFEGVGYANEGLFGELDKYMPIPEMATYIRNTRIRVENLYEKFIHDKKSADKIQGLFADIEERDRAMAEIKQALPELEVTHALFNNIEVNAKNARKGIAMVSLGEILGISRDEIMACGDGSNDIEMIREVGFGVAMANAIDEVKEAARFVTLSNDEEGVAYAVEKFVLKNE